MNFEKAYRRTARRKPAGAKQLDDDRRTYVAPFARNLPLRAKFSSRHAHLPTLSPPNMWNNSAHFPRWSPLLLLIVLAAGVACTPARKVPPYDNGGPGRWIPLESTPLPDAALKPSIASPNLTPAEHAAKASPSATTLTTIPERPKHILALSGGGMYGAFAAGIINGWTKSQTRPEFDIVTGISTGALIGILAFLGPEYDGQMERFYTTIQRRDVYTFRSWATVPFRDSVASTAPLREIVQVAITDDVVKALAERHKKGRRLYIGTTNLDTRRFVTWDIGAIACGPDPKAAREIIGKVLIASCSLPGVFSPQPIDVEVNGKTYTELHIDGGVIAPIFLPPSVFDAAMPDPGKPIQLQPPANLYVIQAAKSYPEGGPVESKILQVLGASAATVLMAQYRREVSNLYHMSRIAGVIFHMTALSAEFPTPNNGLEFDRKEMNKLYEEGFRVGSGSTGPTWWHSPPERGAGETDPVRVGTKFKVE